MGKGRWLGSARRGYLDYILDQVEEDEGDGAPPDPRYWDAFAMIGCDPSPRHSLSAQVLFADDDLIFSEDEIDEITDVITGYGSRYLWLRHQGVAGATSFVNTSLYGGRVTVDRDFFIIDYGYPYDEWFGLIDVQNLYNRDNVRGLAIADPEWVYNPAIGGYDIEFPEEYWMPIIPSFGVSWEF